MTRILINFLLLTLLSGAISSCKKEEDTVKASASLTIVNAIAGSTALVTNFDNSKNPSFYRTAQQIAAYGFNKYSGYTGDYNLGIYRLADTTTVQYKTTLTLEAGSIKTLYLAGTVAATEGFLITEKLPVYQQADSVVSIRFVNLSKGSGPLNVVMRLQVKTMTSGLDYQGISTFQTISAKAKDPVSYIFDFKDATTGVVVSSYTLSAVGTLLAKNITVALRGIRGGTGTSLPGTFLISNY